MKNKLLGFIIIGVIWLITYLGIDYAINYLTNEVSPFYVNIIVRFVIGLLITTIWISVLFRSENTATKMPWLLLLVLLPIWGVILFLSFARDFKKSKRYKSRILLKNEEYLLYEPKNNKEADDFDGIKEVFKYTSNETNHHIYTNNTKVRIISTGNDFYETYFNKIEEAKKFIFISFYAINDDETGKYLANLLIKKAKQGVEIRIIYDYLGSRNFNNRFLKVLRLHGILAHPIDKLILPIFNTKVNYRYHRKITIVDGKFAFTGGFNIGNEYLFGTRKYNWRDTHMEIEGAIIQSLTALFSRDWYYVTNELITDKKYYPIQTVVEEGIFQLLQSGPDTIPIIRNSYLKLIYAAKKYIYISTPYLGLDKETETALKMAARAGIDVKILIPGKPDKLIVYKVTQSFILPLLESGIKIYKYKHTFNHSKFIVVDDEVGSCGTYNFDVRSALINFENTILMYNRSVSVLKEEFIVDLKKSEEITLMAWGKRSKVNSFITALFNLITPLT